MTLLYLEASKNIFPAAVSNPPLFSNLPKDQEWLVYLFKGNKRKGHVKAQSMSCVCIWHWTDGSDSTCVSGGRCSQYLNGELLSCGHVKCWAYVTTAGIKGKRGKQSFRILTKWPGIQHQSLLQCFLFAGDPKRTGKFSAVVSQVNILQQRKKVTTIPNSS